MSTPYQDSLQLTAVRLPFGVARVLPTRAQWLRDVLAKLKPLKPVKLTSVRTGIARSFPQWQPGMTTREYVERYAAANDICTLLLKCPHDCANFDGPAPVLDPAVPEWEQLPDADEAPDTAQVTAW